MPTAYRIEMSGIYKSFGGVNVLKNVSLKVRPGEIHALVGENGAGKSTLIKILSGAYQKDSGIIRIDGETVEISEPHDSRALGIGVIYQEFSLVPDLTVAENMFLHHLGVSKKLIHWRELNEKARVMIQRLGFDISPRKKVRDLSVANQQVIEIARALSDNVRVLILDEPTAVLAPGETVRLFEVLNKLRDQGVGIIYISHRLEEIFQISDMLTAMMDGSVTGNAPVKSLTLDKMIRMMIGRNLTTMFPSRKADVGSEVLTVENLSSPAGLKEISFSVKSGEVLGIAGLVGSMRTETARAVFGADPVRAGTVRIDGRKVTIKSPDDAVRAGIGLVPEDRKNHGVLLGMSVRDNMTMADLRKVTGRFGFIHRHTENACVRDLIRKLSVKTPSESSVAGNLSGGNQQKVVLAKWFHTDCRCIILDEPTRGVDVGAKVEIYSLINELAEKGLAVIVISSDLMEVIGICDRVMVMREGRVQGFLGRADMTEENIMRLSVLENATDRIYATKENRTDV